DRGGRAAWLGRVPDGARLPAVRHGRLLVQQWRTAALPRHVEGCDRSQRLSLSRTLRHLAEAPAGATAMSRCRTGSAVILSLVAAAFLRDPDAFAEQVPPNHAVG